MSRKRFCDSFELKKSWRALEFADHPGEVEKRCLSDPDTETFSGRQHFLAFHLENLIFALSIENSADSAVIHDPSLEIIFFSLSCGFKNQFTTFTSSMKDFQDFCWINSFDHTNSIGWCSLLHPNAVFGHWGWGFLKKIQDVAVVCNNNAVA